MKELIYSRQFPDLDGLDVSEAELLEVFNEVAEKTKDEFMFVDLPEREVLGKKFIERAKAIADKYEYDIEIYSNLSEIEVNLSFDHQLTYSDFPRFIGMADDISIHADVNGREFTICLTYFTCEVYRNGKKVIPYPDAEA